MSTASMTTPRGSNRFFGKSRLNIVLVVPFILQIVAAVGLVGYLSFQNGQRAVNDLASQLLDETSNRIQEHTLTYLEKPHQTQQMLYDAIKSGLLRSNDFDMVRRYFWQLATDDKLASPWFGYQKDNGESISIERFADGRVDMRIVTTESAPVRHFVWLDEMGNPKEIHAEDNYDGTKLAWYQLAKKVGTPTWGLTSPLPAFPTELSTGALTPVFAADGTLIGDLQQPVRLTRITEFLTGLTISPHGQSFIIERSGDLVASSTITAPTKISGEGTDRKAERLPAISSGDALVEATAKSILDRFGSFAAIQASDQLRISIDQAWHYVQVKSIQDGRGLDWLVVVVVPEADFMGQINANTRTTILLCLAALLVAIVVGILTARWVASPILRLNAAAGAVASGNLDQQVEAAGVAEVNQLGHSFNRMARQLKELFEGLEEKVRERTAQLASANEEISVLNEQLKAENLRMGAELEVTRRLQQMLLPKKSELQAIPQLDIAGYMAPAAEVGGDYYDVLRLNGSVKIGIGDVTDHGLESGVVMLMAQTAVRTLLTSGEQDPVRFLDVLNRTVYGNVQRMQTDRNLSLALIDYEDGQVRLSGQHEELILIRKDRTLELVDTRDLGFPIGLDEEAAEFFHHTTLDLATGDGFVLYTDGITEAENAAGEQYGLGRLCQVATHHWDMRAEAIKESIISDVRLYIGDHVVYDDITLVVVKQKEAAFATAPLRGV